MPFMRGQRLNANKPGNVPANCGGRPRLRCVLRRLLPLAIVLCLLALFAFAPFLAGPRSLAVVSLYDLYCEQSSLPSDAGLKLELPIADAGFHPVMVTFNDDAGMSSWLGTPVRFTVDYAVGGFALLSPHSRFYDPEDPLYAAYVGAYYLQGLGKAPDEKTVMRITEFDQRCLALPAVGLDTGHAVFRVDNVQTSGDNLPLAGYGWRRYDAAITTNGPEHTKRAFQSGYILFGGPPPASEQYPLRQMSGRVYVTYFEAQDLTVALYVLAQDRAVVDGIDRRVLSKASLVWKRSK